VAPVGPTVETATVALAGNTPGVPTGIRYESELLSDLAAGDEQQPTQPTLAATEAPEGTAAPAAAAGETAGALLETASARADAYALAQAEWLVRLGTTLRGFLKPGQAIEGTKPANGKPRAGEVLVQRDAASGRIMAARVDSEGREESQMKADLGAAAALVVTGFAAYQLRRPVQSWWRRVEKARYSGAAPSRPLGRGPHSGLSQARAATRMRKPRCLS
jgi:hypothetical protein